MPTAAPRGGLVATVGFVMLVTFSACGSDSRHKASGIQPTSLANVGDRQSEEDERNDAIQQLSAYLQENKERSVKELCDTFRENLEEDRTKALRGDAVAHWSVANWYASDTCVSDLRKSAFWMEKAASLGIVSAIEIRG